MDTEQGPSGDGERAQPAARRACRDEHLPALPDRYQMLAEIARGGFGLVLRARDRVLRRDVAMKILHRAAADDDEMRARFILETEVTAQLQHPGIVTIFDRGVLPDDRPWYTMEEVRGSTLAEAIDHVHRAGSAASWTLRRLVDAFARVAQAVGYAHQHGIVHRDLKPANIMLGAFGEVLVMDWGLARRMDADGPNEPLEDTLPVPPSALRDDAPDGRCVRAAPATRGVLGTPAYMSPEQARGDWSEHGFASDVFSLGANLYQLLSGQPPYRGQPRHILRQAIEGAPVPLRELLDEPDADLMVLAGICERAMRQQPAERYPNADELGRDVLDWLDGARRRERAASVLRSAAELKQRAQVLRRQAQQQQQQAVRVAGELMPHSPLGAKTACWRLEDSAGQTLREAAVIEARWLEKIHAALNLDPRSSDARVALGRYYDERLLLAERRRDTERIAHYETLLNSYAARGFIEGGSQQGALTLHTRPAGAEVLVERYQLIDRELVPVAIELLGQTPLDGVPLPRGSYRLRLRAAGCEEVCYPILIERGRHWDGIPPGASAPHAIVLPPAGSLAPDDIYVPAGWCQIGGDVQALDSLPAQRVWIDGFIIKKHPVTDGAYARLIEHLIGERKIAEAESARSSPGLGYDRSAERPGRASSDAQPRLPAVLVTWQGAQRYAAWLAQQSGLPWRLPHGIEREKAARGVDGRRCPWGDHVDPAFAVMAESHTGTPRRASVDDHRADISPYGVTGLAGNVRDWCANGWAERGPTLAHGRLVLGAASERGEYRVVRGGAWMSTKLFCLAAARFALKPELRRASTGFRLVRSYPAAADEP